MPGESSSALSEHIGVGEHASRFRQDSCLSSDCGLLPLSPKLSSKRRMSSISSAWKLLIAHECGKITPPNNSGQATPGIDTSALRYGVHLSHSFP